MPTRTFTARVNKNERVEFIAKLDHNKTFSLTFNLYDRGELVACGMGGEVFERHLSAAYQSLIARVRRWHLTNAFKGPMHYIDDALYWAGCLGWCSGEPTSPPNLEHFKSTVVWGAAKDDADNEARMLELFEARDKAGLTELLQNRFRTLMETFDADMRELFGDAMQEAA